MRYLLLLFCFFSISIYGQAPTTMKSGLYLYPNPNYNNSSPYRPVVIKDDSFLISRIAFADSASAGEIIQDGGKYGKLYNTNTGGALGGIGVTRMGGFAKQSGSGYYLNGYFDISAVTGNSWDTAVLFMGFMDTTDFSGTRIEVSDSNITITSNGYQENNAQGNQSNNVQGDQNNNIQGNQGNNVQGDQNNNIQGDQTNDIQGNSSLTADTLNVSVNSFSIGFKNGDSTNFFLIGKDDGYTEPAITIQTRDSISNILNTWTSRPDRTFNYLVDFDTARFSAFVYDTSGIHGYSQFVSGYLTPNHYVQKWFVDSVNNSDTLKYFRTDRPLKLDSVPQTTSGDSLLTLVNGVVSKVRLTDMLNPIYVTHGSTFVDSSYYAFGVATANKVVDSIFLLNLNESFSNIAIQNSRQLKYISARNLTYVSGAYNINGNSALTKAYSPNLEFAISVAANALPMIDSLDFNRLKYLGSDFVASANITMTYLGLDSLIAIGGNFNIQGDSMITSLNLGSLLDYGGTVNTTGCKSMTSLTLNPNLKCGGSPTFTLNGCAFTQASVDNILGALVSSGVTNGTVNLSGGTSATPSATGLAFKATLVSSGWTVTHN